MSAARAAPRLLVLTPDFPPARGGIQALTAGLVDAIERFDVRVVALRSPGFESYDAASGASLRRVAAPAQLGAARNLPLNAAAAVEALRYRPAVTLSMHIVTSPAAAAISALLGAPYVQYFHANEIARRPRLSAFAARRAAVTIAVSSYTASLLRAAGAVPRRLELIPPGVDIPDEPAASAVVGREDAERPTLLTIGRLAGSYKGHDVLLRALPSIREQVPDVVWVVIGDGPERRELEGRAHAAGLAGNVRFLGAVSDAERDAWLVRADVFAMPSRLPGGGLAGEGFGIAYMEAAAHGTPVVAGAVGGALDAVADGETGLLVDPLDADAVAGAIVRLLLDRELAARLGSAAAERARSFAWPKIAVRVEDVMLSVLGAGDA
jgi:phosphatidylinositol alpha-1,6-mannosyltransferase